MRNNVKILLKVVVVEFEISNNNKKKNRAAAAISDAREWLNAGLAGPLNFSSFPICKVTIRKRSRWILVSLHIFANSISIFFFVIWWFEFRNEKGEGKT